MKDIRSTNDALVFEINQIDESNSKIQLGNFKLREDYEKVT